MLKQEMNNMKDASTKDSKTGGASYMDCSHPSMKSSLNSLSQSMCFSTASKYFPWPKGPIVVSQTSPQQSRMRSNVSRMLGGYHIFSGKYIGICARSRSQQMEVNQEGSMTQSSTEIMRVDEVLFNFIRPKRFTYGLQMWRLPGRKQSCKQTSSFQVKLLFPLARSDLQVTSVLHSIRNILALMYLTLIASQIILSFETEEDMHICVIRLS